MANSEPLIGEDGEVRDIANGDLAKFKAAGDALPASLQQKLGVRGAQKAPTKTRITVRLSPDVVDRFRATGQGWQGRMDEVLQNWLKDHPQAG